MAGLDRIMRVEAFHSGGGKIYAHGYDEAGGGPAATASVAISRLGGQAVLVARLGADAAGATIESELRAYGVDTSAVARLPGALSPTSQVTVDAAGERQITHFRGLGLDVAPDWVDATTLAGVRCVLVDMGWWPGASRLVALAREAGIPSVLDVDFAADPRCAGLLPLVDHAIFSQAALARMSDCDEPISGLRWARTQVRPPCTVGVTLGSEGYAWLQDDEPHFIAAHAVRVVDTLGAGDVFHGAYALGLAEGLTIRAAAELANAAAAIKCTRPSGRKGVPSRKEVTTLIAQSDVNQP
jgi:sulfofructose kinase